MSSLNRATLIGHVGHAPEMRSTQAGDRIANFTMATSESWKDKASGERKERTEWHRVVVFNDRLAEIVERYVRKGSKLLVEGKIATRKWTDKDGVERYSTEIVLSNFDGKLLLLDSAGSNRAPPADNADDYGSARTGAAGAYADRHGDPKVRDGAARSDLDDEIPF